ncbi:hypothetical protein L3Q82_018325, partial [Scortum barcoo]
MSGQIVLSGWIISKFRKDPARFLVKSGLFTMEKVFLQHKMIWISSSLCLLVVSGWTPVRGASIFSVCGTETTIPCTSSNTTLTKLIWRFNHSQIILIQTRTDRTVSEEWRQQVKDVSESGKLTLQELSSNQEGIYTYADVFCVFGKSCILPCSFQGGTDVVLHWINVKGDTIVHSYFNNRDQLAHQEQRFRGRTSLFKEQISRRNASLQLTEVKVQDQGRYKCFTSLVIGNKESFINVKVDAPVGEVDIQQVGNRITCSSEGIYPEPELTWSTSPPSNVTFNNTATVQQTEQQLYNISSSLIVSDSVTDLVYSCTVSTRTNSRRASLKFCDVCGTETTIPCTSSNTTLTKLIWRFNHSQIILIQTRTDRTVSEEWRQQVKDVSESGKLTLQELSSNQEGIYTCELRNEEETKITNTFLRTDNCQGISTSLRGFIIGVVAASVIGAVLVLVGLVIYRKKTRGILNLEIQIKQNLVRTVEHRLTNICLMKEKRKKRKIEMDKKRNRKRMIWISSSLCFLVVSGWTPARGDADVFCVFGKSCILPCSFQGGTDVVLHWVNVKGDTIVHSYYNNRDQLAHQEQRFRGRTSLFKEQISRGNASLQLTEVEVQDQERYKCFTSLVIGNKESIINVKVDASIFSVCGAETTIPCTSSNTTLTKLIWRFNHSQIILIQTRTDRTVSEEWRQQVKDVSESGKLTLQELSSNQEGIYTWISTSVVDADVFCVFGKSCILPCSFQGGTDVVLHWIHVERDTHVHSYYNNRDQLAHQEQRFRGRTSLFKEQISRGNASLQLTEVEVQDQGRYKCFTSLVIGNKESFISLKVDALVGEVDIQQVGNRITCSSEGIYPEPELTWSTSPPSNVTFNNTATVQQTEQQLYNISSSLIVSDSVTDLVYSCTISTRTNSRRASLTFSSVSVCGTETTIPCTSSNTTLTKLIWRFNHSQIILIQTRTDRTVSEEWRQQ